MHYCLVMSSLVMGRFSLIYFVPDKTGGRGSAWPRPSGPQGPAAVLPIGYSCRCPVTLKPPGGRALTVNLRAEFISGTFALCGKKCDCPFAEADVTRTADLNPRSAATGSTRYRLDELHLQVGSGNRQHIFSKWSKKGVGDREAHQ